MSPSTPFLHAPPCPARSGTHLVQILAVGPVAQEAHGAGATGPGAIGEAVALGSREAGVGQAAVCGEQRGQGRGPRGVSRQDAHCAPGAPTGAVLVTSTGSQHRWRVSCSPERTAGRRSWGLTCESLAICCAQPIPTVFLLLHKNQGNQTQMLRAGASRCPQSVFLCVSHIFPPFNQNKSPAVTSKTLAGGPSPAPHRRPPAGQLLLLHICCSLTSPLQGSPPCWGSGLLHTRVRSRMPPAQVTVQADQGDQGLHRPSTAGERGRAGG